MKKIIVGILSFVLLFVGQNAFADATTWNTASNDCSDIAIANYTTNNGYGSPCWTGTNINANPGDTINVRVYYHNTGSVTATNTRIKVFAPTGSSTNHSFSAQILSPEGNLYSGNVSVNIPTSQTLTYTTTKWFPNQTTSAATLLNGQSGTEVLGNNGLSIGNIAPGWATQGTVVVAFKVGNTQPQNCSIDSFTANPSNINPGASSTLNWNTTDCASVKLDNNSVSLDGSQSVSPTTTTTYTLKAYNSSGTLVDTSSALVTVQQITPNCTINSFTANPSSITSGSSSVLNWSTSNCTNVTISNLGYSVPVSGSQSVWPTVTTTYVLTATGSNGGTQTRTATVNVNQITPNCTINSFTANPSSIASGASSTLSWSTNNCTSVSISPRIDRVSLNGSEVVHPTVTTTYVLTATGSNGGTQTRTATVNVNQITPNCKINSFTANPSSITSGSSSVLNWSTSNCTNVTISNLGYSVPVSGSQSVWPTVTTTYTLNAQGANGVGVGAQTIVHITPITQNCTINSFTANPSSITSGSSSVLNWSTSNCIDVSLNGADVQTSGSRTVYPTVTTTYNLIARGSNGVTQTRNTTVVVKPITQNCTINSFTANPSSITSGSSSVLNWSTSNCTNVTISNLGYSVPVSGSQSVWPTVTTTYVLTATSPYGNLQTSSATVVVDPINNRCVINSFTSNPSSITSGSSSTLSWNTSNCNRVTLDGSEVVNSGSRTVYPTSTKTYTLIASDMSVGGGSVTAQTTVYVNEIGNSCEITSFTASDTSIDDGDSTILRWNTNNCERVKISDVGDYLQDDGSRTVSPDSDTTYVLTAYANDGSHTTATLRIYVDEDNNNDEDDCSIDSYTASDTYISRGDEVTLRWRTTDCDDVSISSIGDVDDDGSETVSPYSTTTYLLKARGDNGSDSESIRITVDNDYNVVVYNTNVVTTVATNISQTGAQVNGLITNSNYGNTNTYFEYGTNVNLGIRTSSRSISGSTNFSEYLTNLSPNTIYYFRAVAEGQNGPSFGAIEVFRTLGYVNYNNNTTNVQTVREVVYQQGTTVVGSESPIVLRIENKYQTIGIGDTIDYIVFYKNISNLKLVHPMVQVFVPQGITITNASRGTYSEDNRTLSVPIEDLLPGTEGAIYLEARVDFLEANLAQVVTTAVLVYTNPNGAQENAMAYVLNNPKVGSVLGASAFFGGMFGMSLIGWLLLIILIMLLILAARTFYTKRDTTTINHF